MQFDLGVECAVCYMEFRDCLPEIYILLQLCSYWWNVQSAMMKECAVGYVGGYGGHGRSWKVMEGHGKSWKVIECH